MNNRFYSQAEVFVEIVRQGSLTEAANALRLSKSNVSQKLAEMEADLNSTLLQRSTRSIALTAAGQRVFDLCVHPVDALQSARSEVLHELGTTELQGIVTVSGSNAYLDAFILPLMPRLHEAFPKVRIDLVGGDQPVDQKSETVDLRIRVGDVQVEGAKVYPLPSLERVLCYDTSLRDRLVHLDHPSALSTCPIILRAQENPTWTFRKGDQTVTHKVTSPVMVVNNYELCLAAVRSGAGAAIMARAVVSQDIGTGEMLEMLPDWRIDPIPVSLVIPMHRLRKPEVHAVAQYVAAHCGVKD